jgi:hypothetical protein
MTLVRCVDFRWLDGHEVGETKFVHLRTTSDTTANTKGEKEEKKKAWV